MAERWRGINLYLSYLAHLLDSYNSRRYSSKFDYRNYQSFIRLCVKSRFETQGMGYKCQGIPYLVAFLTFHAKPLHPLNYRQYIRLPLGHVE
jgi:hypothetical protein